MKNILFLLLTTTLFLACQSDQAIQEEFSGTYEISIEAPETNQDLSNAKRDMKRDMKKARKDMNKEIEEAKKEIEEEFGEDSDLGKAISSFVEGAGHLANSMTNLGESLGEMGIDLGTSIIQNINFEAEFRKDGEVAIGRKKRISFRSDDLHWKIKDGKMLLWNDGDESEDEADVFEIVKVSDKEFDLVGEEVTFHLIKEE